MSETEMDFKPGDVVRYDTGPDWHGREGMAIAEARLDGVVLFDTYWRTPGGRHPLTYDELAAADLVFNLDDYDELTERGCADRWKTYKPVDRETITSQHRLVVRWFVRKGAQPDLETQVENAQQVLATAEDAAQWAQRRVVSAREDLARLQAAQWAQS